MSQASEILARLRAGDVITPRDAYERHGTLALHSVVSELRPKVRARGYEIECAIKSSGRKRWGEYRLVKVVGQPDLFGGAGQPEDSGLVLVPQKDEGPR